MNLQFPELAALLGQDSDKVRLVARAFYRSAAMDLQRLQDAAAAQKWKAVSEFAQRIQLDCLQLSESNAANVVAELGRLPAERFADAYDRYQPVITELLSHMEDFAR